MARLQRQAEAKRRWGWLAIATVVAMALGLFGLSLDTPATAAGSGIGGSNFDAGNGALDTTGGTVTVRKVEDRPSGNQDDTYAGDGAAEPATCPAVDLTHAAPQKSDITNFYYGVDTDAPGVLYLAWDRKFAGGTLAIDFEFNKGKIRCANGVNPNRQDGDLMVVYEFDGGSVQDIQVRTWGAGAWSAPVTPVPGSAQQKSISANQLFGELSINLADPFFHVLDPAKCDAFAMGWAKSRTGNSFDTSKVKDFVAPTQLNVSNCGKLTIVKDARPDGPTDFAFTGTGSDLTYGGDVPASFSLDDDANATLSNTTSFLAHPQTVTITEGPAAGWSLDDLTCSGTGSAGVTKDKANRNISVALKAGDDITCTFVNTQPNTLTIVKDATPDNARDFGFTATGTGVDPTFTLDDDGAAGSATPNSKAFSNLAPGVYTVTEDAATGWDLTNAGCTGATATLVGRTLTITLTNGQSPTCTFENTKVAPTILTTKTPSPTSVPEPGADVTFSVTVQNTSPLDVTITDLVDDVYGDITKLAPPANGTQCATGTVLAPNATYSCRFVAPVTGTAGSTHNDTVTAKGTDADGVYVEHSASATVAINDVLPEIAITKTPSATVVHSGDAVTYTYVVTNKGVEEVALTTSDDKCSPITGPKAGDDKDADGKLDVNETWTLSCNTNLSATTTNVVTATGTDDEGNTSVETATATVAVVTPAIAITKTPSLRSVDPGTTVVYTYTVTNPGDVALSKVGVADDKCSPVTYVSGDINGDSLLQSGETWLFRCSQVQTGAVDTLTNVGTATGTDPLGKVVTSKDTVTVSVVAPLVLEQPKPAAPAPAAAPAPVAVAPVIVTLPRTGIDVRGWVEFAGSLILLGLALLLTARTRRRTA